MNEVNLIAVLIQDLKCCYDNFLINNFQQMSILSNRIMENCVFSDNHKYFLPGIMLRDVSFDFIEIRRSFPEMLEPAKEIGIKLLDYLNKFYYNDLNEKLIWKEFFDYSINIRQFQKNQIETQCYKENLEFSNYIFINLLNFFKTNKTRLFELGNNFFDGIINFLVRIIQRHSCNLKNIMIYLYFQSIFSLYQYIVRKNLNNVTGLKYDIEIELFPLIDYIINEFPDREINYETYNKNLWRIIKKMRELYIIYKPLPSRSP